VGDLSSLAIETSRFGRVEIDPSTVIEFPEGLIGLAGSRYALLARDPETPFVWLQSLDDPTLALPVCNPHRFFADFSVELTDEDAERLRLDDATEVDVYVTVCAAEALEDFVANQKAPILVWAGRGYQVINQAPGRQLRAPLFAEVVVEQAPAAPPAC
jgi:flagellar assembly factor FliW